MRKLLRVLLALLAGLLVCSLAHAGTVTYVYTDPQGTTLAEADASGNVTATFDYRPYGSIAMGTPPTGPGYTGHVNDPDTGLVYMQARYYDPAVGRFLSVDPVSLSGGNFLDFGRYNYATNNPVNKLDPDGKEAGYTYLANGGMELTSMENARLPSDAVMGLLPGTDVINCMASGCGAGGWIMAGIGVVPVDGKVAQLLGKVSKEIYLGSKLARNMAREGSGVLKGAEEAHHIVAKNAKAAESARDVLNRQGIGIDDAVNGAAMEKSAHRVEHTAENYNRVNERVIEAERMGGRAGVENALREIAKEKANP